ncbi:MAG: hypothetical protein ABSE49_21200, partial [Polyangiaceae bacterium]
RALLALGSREWAPADASAPVADVEASVASSPPGPLRIAVLLSDAGAALAGRANGRPLAEAARSEGEVRWLEGGAPALLRTTLDLHASSGSVLGVWVLGAGPRLTGRLD